MGVPAPRGDGDPSVLVLTAAIDPTADLVVAALRRRGARIARFDTAEFPTKATFTAHLTADQPRPRWRPTLRAEHGDVALDDLTAIYYRRPGRLTFSADVDPAHRAWCEGQARYGFWGVLESLPTGWVNYPPAIAAAEYKPRQLAIAVELGLSVPDTLITNDPDEVAAFSDEHPGGVVTKALYARGPRDPDGTPTTVLYTSLVPPERARDDTVALTAHLLQEFVAKRHDVRLTVVDDHLYPAAIHDADPTNVTDWRRSHRGLSYEVCEVPDDVADRARALVRRLGLRFAALDFLVNPAGDWVFIEVNANGQWAWVQRETGLAIADGLADALLTPPADHPGAECPDVERISQ